MDQCLARPSLEKLSPIVVRKNEAATGHCRVWKTLEHSVLSELSPSNSSLWVQETLWKKSNKDINSEGMEDIKATRPSRHNSTDTRIHSQRLRQHTQGLHRSKPDGALALPGERRPARILTTSSILSAGQLLAKARLYTSNGYKGIEIKCQNKQAPCLARLPTQNRLYGIFGDSLSRLIMLCLGFFWGGAYSSFACIL